MDNNTGLMSLGEIIKSKQFNIPMYQRNYKWSMRDCEKLIEDLIISYKNNNKKSIGLITLFKNNEDENTYDIIDGQQRFITLSIIGVILNSDELIDKINFDRDENCERKNVIKNLNQQFGFTDGDRIVRNLKRIKEILDKNSDIDISWEYIKNNCLMLCGVVSNNNAIGEFMNLNAYKTPFSICDYVRSNLITLNTFYKDELEKKEDLLAMVLGSNSYKTSISKLYEEIVEVLYKETICIGGEYENVFNVISKNCDDVYKFKESRINIIFNEYLERETKDGYRCSGLNFKFDKWIKELVWIKYIKNLILQLEDEINQGNFYSAKLIDYNCKKDKNGYGETFFSLISKDVSIENQSSNELIRILEKKNSIDSIVFKSFKPNETKKANLFLEALCTSQNNTSLEEIYYKDNRNKDSLNLKLSENIINNCIRGTGKYIINKFLDEQQKSKDSYFNTIPILDLEDIENPKFKEWNLKNDELSVSELFEHNIKIPIIQRDYCMGSSILINKDSKEENFLSFIIKSFELNQSIVASTIITAIDKDNNVYIFDGQQRTYTIYQILKYLKVNGIKEYSFIGRKEVINNIDKPNSYIEESVYNLINQINKVCETMDKNKLDRLIMFVKNNIKFKVKVITETSDAEQFFMDINGGVPLENYEIFKSCLIENIQENIKESFVKKLENEWLNLFYNLNKQIPKDTNDLDENSEEELIQIRFIEFICRWIYNKNNCDEEVLPFDMISSKGKLVSQLAYLKKVDINKVILIMDNIVNKFTNHGYEFEKVENTIKFINQKFKINSYNTTTIVGYGTLNNDCKIQQNEKLFIERFIRSHSKIGRKKYFNRNHKEATKYYDNDKIINEILIKLSEERNNYIDSKIDLYKEKKLNNEIHLLGGYHNWNGRNITRKFDKITAQELPIYYIDEIFKDNCIDSYCNLYIEYNNILQSESDYIKHMREIEDSIFLFLVTGINKKIIFDKGEYNSSENKIFIDVFEHEKYIDMCVIRTHENKEYYIYLNEKNSYSIRLNNEENTILNKKY